MKSKHICVQFVVLLFILLPLISWGEVSSAIALAAKESNAEIQELPIYNILFVEKDGKYKVISMNGRYEFVGKLIDRWSNEEINSYEKAKKSFEHINFDGMNFRVNTLDPIIIGHGPKQVAIFIDPTCPFCKQLLKKLPQDSGEFTFKLILVGMLSKRAQTLVKQMTCAKNKKDIIPYLLLQNFTTALEQEQNCSEEKQSAMIKRYVAAQMMNIKTIPFIIRYDGKIARGLPQGGAMKWLRSK